MAHNLTSLRNLHIGSSTLAVSPYPSNPISPPNGSSAISPHTAPGVPDQQPKIPTRTNNSHSVFEFAPASSPQVTPNELFRKARMYATGKGVATDHAKGAAYYIHAAMLGHLGAQFNAAICYSKGEGVEKDPRVAFKFFTMAAAQGNPDAQYNVGVFLEHGEYVEKDTEKALQFYKLAAEQSHALAQAKLKHFASEGAGPDAQTVPGNSAKNSSSAGDVDQGSFARRGEAMRGSLTDLMNAANQGQPEAQICLSEAYLVGKGVPEDPVKALEWLSKAAEQGHPFACYTLGMQCYGGFGVVPQDQTKAFNLFKRAADQKSHEAMYMLAECYRQGNGVKEDGLQSVKWLSAAAECGNEQAKKIFEELSSRSKAD
jgi:TPR repeat protein